MDDDFWTTEIANTPEEDSAYSGIGKAILIVVLAACAIAAVAGYFLH